MSYFPPDVKSSQLVSFLKVVHQLGGVTEVAKVARELRMDLTMLLPILNASEILDLVSVEKGVVKLTSSGEEMQTTSKGDIVTIGEALRRVEPFKTAVGMRTFSARQVAELLASRGVRWHHEDDLNAIIVKEMLIDWGIKMGLFDYDGSASLFTVKPQD